MPKKKPLDDFVVNYRHQDQESRIMGETSAYFAEYKVRKLLEWLPQLQNENINILDFGCGDGLMTEYLRRYFLYAKIDGVDVSAKSINTARNTVNNVQFNLIANNTIPCAPKFYDLIIAAEVFHHIQRAKQQFWCDQLQTLLKPTGCLVIFELNPLNLGTQLTFRTHPMEKNACMLWPWQLKKLLHNFLRSSLIFYNFFPRWFKILRAFEPWLTKVPFGGLYAGIAHNSH